MKENEWAEKRVMGYLSVNDERELMGGKCIFSVQNTHPFYTIFNVTYFTQFY